MLCGLTVNFGRGEVMSQTLIFSVAGVALFFVGLFSLIFHDHLLRKVLAVNVMGSGIFLFLVSIARRIPDSQPDPVPHAMVLTGIVVTVSATALALTLVKRIYLETGKPELSENERE